MSDADMTTVTPLGLSPYLTIKDARGQEAVEFYAAAFGGVEQVRHLAQDGKRVMHARLQINGGLVMLSDDFPDFNNGVAAPEPAGVMIHLEVDDADAWFERALAAGASVRMPLADQFWGDRYGQLNDPFGHRWSIGSAKKSA
jgi:PhnB protein